MKDTGDPMLEAMRETDNAEPVTKKRRALLVEDDADMRRLLAWMLRKEGLEVVEAKCGVDLLEWINRTAAAPWDRFFDLIVSDISMPDLTAIEVMAALRCRSLQVPVILITAFGDAETRREGRELGAFAILDKPLGREDLRAALRAVSAASAAQPMEVSNA